MIILHGTIAQMNPYMENRNNANMLIVDEAATFSWDL